MVLIGPNGTGKSTLALNLAYRARLTKVIPRIILCDVELNAHDSERPDATGGDPEHASEDLAGVHDAEGIKQLLDFAHQANFERVFILVEIVALELADTMFSADAAAVARDLVEHFRRQRLAVLCEVIVRRTERADRL